MCHLFALPAIPIKVTSLATNVAFTLREINSLNICFVSREQSSDQKDRTWYEKKIQGILDIMKNLNNFEIYEHFKITQI